MLPDAKAAEHSENQEDNTASIRGNKVEQKIYNSGTIEIVATCAETLSRSQEAALTCSAWKAIGAMTGKFAYSGDLWG